MYSKEIKEKALELLSQGKNAKSVQSILAEEYELTISIPTIYSWKKKARDVSEEDKSSSSQSVDSPIEEDKIDNGIEATKPNQDGEKDKGHVRVHVFPERETATIPARQLRHCRQQTTRHFFSPQLFARA